MNISDGFPNNAIEWILIVIATGVTWGICRALFNMISCGFGITRNSRASQAESLRDRYSCAMYVAEQSSEPLFSSDDEHKLFVNMLEENLDWAIERWAAERTRRIWESLQPWNPPRPNLVEMLRSPGARVIHKLNRHPVHHNWESVVNELVQEEAT